MPDSRRDFSRRSPALRFLRLVAVMTFPGALAIAQPPQPKAETDALYRTVAALEEAIFHAYNTCDLPKLGSLVTDDLEFYHDQTGLAVGRQIFVDSIRQNICGKVTRELVPGTLEVHVLKGYGAVEIGVHRFHHPGKDQTEPVGEGKFVMIWKNDGGVWKLSRVISYDHGLAAK